MALFNYNVEPTLESALVTLLQAAGVTASPALSASELAKPYVTVSFELGAEQEIDVPTPDGNVSNSYEGQYTVTVVTDRDYSNGEHATLRATARRVLAESTGAEWAAALGSQFRLRSIRHLSTTYDVLNPESGIDASVMSYAVKLQLAQG